MEPDLSVSLPNERLCKDTTKSFSFLYRCCLAASVEGDLTPGGNEGPGGSEGCHVLEIFPDILSGSLQGL